jgi:hypothetical protein
VLTVTFGEAPGGATVLTLVHERLDDLAAAMPDVAANVGPGWDCVLGNLADVLASDMPSQALPLAGDQRHAGALNLP